MLKSNNFQNKVVLITGSNRGIGNSILQSFANEKAEIILCVRTVDSVFETQINDLMTKYMIKIHILIADLTNLDLIKQLVNQKIKEIGKIDVLVNNAGVAHGGLLQMTSISKIKEVFDINFFSQINLIQIVSKFMIKQKQGSIINIASIAGIDSYPGYIGYGCSKAALIYSTKTLAKELAPHNIRINSIAPGLTDTDMANQMELKAKDKLVFDSAMNRMCKPNEIAESVLFLAGDNSSFINGQTIRVDGGM